MLASRMAVREGICCYFLGTDTLVCALAIRSGSSFRASAANRGICRCPFVAQTILSVLFAVMLGLACTHARRTTPERDLLRA